MTATDALWYLGRGTGVVALVVFTITVVLGITTRSGRSVLGIGRFGVAELHKTASLTGVGLILVHVGTLLFDPWAQLHLVDTVLPFLAGFRPLWQGLGTLAVDLLALLTVSSLLRHHIGPRVFRALHWTAYGMWPLAMAHALGTGSDATTSWFRGLAVACAAVVMAALTWRTSTGFAERGMRRRPRVVAQ